MRPAAPPIPEPTPFLTLAGPLWSFVAAAIIHQPSPTSSTGVALAAAKLSIRRPLWRWQGLFLRGRRRSPTPFGPPARPPRRPDNLVGPPPADLSVRLGPGPDRLTYHARDSHSGGNTDDAVSALVSTNTNGIMTWDPCASRPSTLSPGTRRAA
jgi:hypothetical protein